MSDIDDFRKPGGEEPPAGRAADRFERRRTEIVAAAVPLMNAEGFKGMRLTAVAELIGLRSTGVTYYFPRKEDLAVACIESGLVLFHGFIDESERQPTIAARVTKLVAAYVEYDAAVRRGEAPPLASFAPIRSLESEQFERMSEAYSTLFRRVRSLFEGPELEGLPRTALSLRTLMLLEQLYWASSWLGDVDLDEFPRIAERLSDVMLHGLAAEGSGFAPGLLTVNPPVADADAAKESFLRAATREINRVGYHGASVDRIAASLNLTKGAFYHYNEAKDDLVAECFRRTFDLVRRTKLAVKEKEGSEWWRMSTAVNSLIAFQISDEGPLMRTRALSSLPREYQREILDQTYRSTRSFSAMVSDCLAEGSVRPIDQAIGATVLAAGINAAADMRDWRAPLDDTYPAAYVRPLLYGFLSR